MKCAQFFREFIKRPKQVGTLNPSSQILSKEMARQIDGASNVIEFGGGQGAVTLQILKRLPENGRLTSFEINPSFCEDLRSIKDPRLKVINDDAANCERHLDSVDYIVSSLPLRVFDKSHRKRILDISSKSKKYVQLQYSPFLRKRLDSYFKNVKTKFVLRNIPPAIIYICEASAKSKS